jgi:hypothetical protein
MVEAVLISGRGCQHNAIAMSISHGFLSEVRVIVGTNGGHGNPGPGVHRVDEPWREVVDIHDEAVPDPDLQQGGTGGHPIPSRPFSPSAAALFEVPVPCWNRTLSKGSLSSSKKSQPLISSI